jgi:hypothetical protein
MKKLLAIIFISLVLVSTSYADIKVLFMNISPWGGASITYSASIPDMTKLEVRNILGSPWREYGYLDTWLGGDQVYLMYYDIMQQPTTVIILPVTSW